MAPLKNPSGDLACKLIYIAAAHLEWPLEELRAEIDGQLAHNTALQSMLSHQTRLWLIPGEDECMIYREEQPGFRQSHVGVIASSFAGTFILERLDVHVLPVRKVLHIDDLKKEVNRPPKFPLCDLMWIMQWRMNRGYKSFSMSVMKFGWTQTE